MIADYQDGGQKMLDIIEFNKALRISWILRYISNKCKSKWKCFFFFHLFKVGGKLVFLSNLAPKDTRKLDIKDDFIQELIELWADLGYSDSFASQAIFSAGHIWNNSMITIAGKTKFYEHWFNAGVTKITRLWQVIQEKYLTAVSAIRSACPARISDGTVTAGWKNSRRCTS